MKGKFVALRIQWKKKGDVDYAYFRTYYSRCRMR